MKQILVQTYCLLFILQLSLTAVARDTVCPSPKDLAELSSSQLDSVSFAACSAIDLVLIVGAAEQMMADTSIDLQIRADMYFNLVAREIQEQSEGKAFDASESTTAFLIHQLEANQYYLDVTRPSDWAKLIHYIEEGRWDYIAKRFIDRNVHYYLGVVLLLSIVLFLGYKMISRKKKNYETDQPYHDLIRLLASCSTCTGPISCPPPEDGQRIRNEIYRQ